VICPFANCEVNPDIEHSGNFQNLRLAIRMEKANFNQATYLQIDLFAIQCAAKEAVSENEPIQRLSNMSIS